LYTRAFDDLSLEEQCSALATSLCCNSSLETPFMRVAIAFAVETDFLHPSAKIVEMVRAMMGWMQSRINENANKILRDSEQRDNASKVVGTWAGVSHSDLHTDDF
jgi:hypothetical protein